MRREEEQAAERKRKQRNKQSLLWVCPAVPVPHLLSSLSDQQRAGLGISNQLADKHSKYVCLWGTVLIQTTTHT